MTLEAIIIRADGAFAETEELRRQSFLTAFREAGFTWDIDRERFAASRSLGSLHQRMAHFVRQYLKSGPRAPDVDQLIAAMHRRASKVFCQLLERGSLPPRAGMRDLVVTARQEGVRLILAAAMDRSEAASLLAHALGVRGADAFDVITAMDERENPVDAHSLYRQVLADTGLAPATCLVIEATLAGTSAAKAAGLPVITTRSVYCLDSPGAGDSAGIFEDLPEVLACNGQLRPEALSVIERAELLAALQRLHSGGLDFNSGVYGSDAMRVSDILKTKGSAVKTIEPTATIRALAQGLRAEVVGAMVVKDAKGGVQGIITERDLARGIAEFGSDLPSMPVSALMTKSVITCAPGDSVATVANVMTHRRIRHLPVVVDGALAGVISIGDVLKHRIDEVQLEANVLREYAMARK